MNWLFMGSMVGYFTMLSGMHLLIQIASTVSGNVYIVVVTTASIILLVSFCLAVADKRFR